MMKRWNLSFVRSVSYLLFVVMALALGEGLTLADGKPIRIGIPTALQVQVGRDTIDAAQLAIDEINAAGGVLGRKLEFVAADETETPETGINAIKKLTNSDKVDVLIGGYTSGVTLAQLPHISAAKTLYLGVGAASPAITAKVKQDYDNYKYIFRINPLNTKWLATFLVDYLVNFIAKEQGFKKIAIVGESAKWVQDLVPVLKSGARDGGVDTSLTELFDVNSADFSPLFAKVRASGAQYLVVLLSHASSDVFVKQWSDAQVPLPIGGIDVKSQDADFFSRVGGKALSETTQIGFMRVPLSPVTVPFWDAFVKRFNRKPVYTAGGTYDAIKAYAAAVTRAKTTQVDAVIKELEKTNMPATAGQLVFDENHDVKYGQGFVTPMMVQWQQNGERVVVWPKDKSNGKFMLPPWLKK